MPAGDSRRIVRQMFVWVTAKTMGVYTVRIARVRVSIAGRRGAGFEERAGVDPILPHAGGDDLARRRRASAQLSTR